MRPLLFLLCALLCACGKSRKEGDTVVLDPGAVVLLEAAAEEVPEDAVTTAATVEETQAEQKSNSRNASTDGSGGDASKKSDKTDPVLPETEKAEPGRVIAGLGDPSQPGLWLQTPLVAREMSGRVVMTKTGAALRLTLLPTGAASTGSSQLSLEAYRQLGAPLTQLIELDVFPGG